MSHAIACHSLLIVAVTVVGETRLFRASVASNAFADATAAEVCNALQLLVVEEEVETPDIPILSCTRSKLTFAVVPA